MSATTRPAPIATPAPTATPAVPPADTIAALNRPWTLGGVPVGNRVLLAPLAGIGNWFVRLQARRHGAGLAVSEMVSSFAVHYRSERTWRELLRIHPDEGPVSIQLFGQDPDVMRSAAASVAEAGAALIDLNMGCPVRKVCKTGAGAALLSDPDRAVRVARAAAEGSGLPVTVKLRSGQRPGEDCGARLARRLVEEAGVSAIGFHPRPAAVGHRGRPDLELAAHLTRVLGAPLILTGGLRDAPAVWRAYETTGASAVMLARGSLGNPWLFSTVLGRRSAPPAADEVLDELEWVLDAAVEHLGAPRAARYLRKFYPWYLAHLEVGKATQDAFQRSEDVASARALIASLRPRAVAA